jgi:hypothetical protein
MKMELRYARDEETGQKTIRGIVLIIETHEESSMVDEAFGSDVAPDGLIAELNGEVRLSDGYGEHYICLEKK